MILGDIFASFNGESQVNESYAPQDSYKKPGKIASILNTLSQYGMSYDDQVYKNMKAIPADKLLQPKDDNMILQSMYSNMNWKIKPEEEKTFHEK